jgi:hypothetical protein
MGIKRSAENSFWCLSFASTNKRINFVRFAHTTGKSLRASPAFYSWRYAKQVVTLDIPYKV